MIHSTAIVDKAARLGVGVRIGPYAVVEADVTLGDGCELQPHAVVKQGSEIDADCLVGHFAVIGGDPQMNGFNHSLSTGVRIGKESLIREHVTVHRSAFEKKATLVGEKVMLMVGSHVGHDCVIGNQVTLANAALLAGHVHLADFVFVGGGAAFHQFVRVGESAMIGGRAEVSADVPPFLTVVDRNLTCGPNLVGLRRRELPNESISEIRSLYKKLFMGTESPPLLAARLLEEAADVKTPEGHRFLEFFADGKRGFVRSRTLSK